LRSYSTNPTFGCRKLIPPGRPSSAGTASKQFDIWTGEETLDATAYLVRFSAVLGDRRHHDLMHILC